MLEMTRPDALGGWRVQTHDGLPRRFACPYPHYRAPEALRLTFSHVQIIHPNHPSVRSPRVLKDYLPRGSLLASR